MGAHSTLNVTRDTALKLYMRAKHPEVTDKELERFLDEALDDALYNAVVVDNSHGGDDDGLATEYVERWMKGRARSGVKVSVPVRQIIEAGFWSDYCDRSGTNEWALNEGLMDRDERVEIEVADARRYGLLD
jgi:hypothetical protein